jgi:hypothetical protein
MVASGLSDVKSKKESAFTLASGFALRWWSKKFTTPEDISPALGHPEKPIIITGWFSTGLSKYNSSLSEFSSISNHLVFPEKELTSELYIAGSTFGNKIILHLVNIMQPLIKKGFEAYVGTSFMVKAVNIC